MFKSVRDKAIIIGLYLSKFDKRGIEELGFNRFSEAYNVLGLSIGAKPASLKNYRDEFDPLFANKRMGWHKRQMREYCKFIYNEYSSIDFKTFNNLIKSFVIKDFDVEEIVEKAKKKYNPNAVAKRLIIGRAAEEYFKRNYKTVSYFNQFEIKDTTNLACGFDFKLSNNSDFFCVEVKGLSGTYGSISLTEKEYRIAKTYTDQFCLFVVMNFIERPYHEIFFDPLNSRLKFKKVEREVIQVNYSTAI